MRVRDRRTSCDSTRRESRWRGRNGGSLPLFSPIHPAWRAALPEITGERPGGKVASSAMLGSGFPSEAQPRKLPACLRRKEIPVGCARVGCRRDARSAAQDVLAAHELAVVVTDCAGHRPIARVRPVVAARPLPDIAEGLREPSFRGCLAQRKGMKCAALEEKRLT